MYQNEVNFNGKKYIAIKVQNNLCTKQTNKVQDCAFFSMYYPKNECYKLCNNQPVVYIEDDSIPVSEEGKKFDDHSTRYDLLPPDALEEIAKVLTWGSFKYDDENWRKVPSAKRRYFAASQRHAWKYKKGEQLDSEHNLHHLAASITNLMFILQLELEELDTPERQAKIKELFKLKSQK